MVTAAETARDAIERAFREDYGRLYASLVGQFRDFELVEDALQEALAAVAENAQERAFLQGRIELCRKAP